MEEGNSLNPKAPVESRTQFLHAGQACIPGRPNSIMTHIKLKNANKTI